jgi:DNA-binding CsgD family transcriptional regulator
MNNRLALWSASSRHSVSFLLAETTFILGRSSKCDLVVADDSVSRRHAEILMVSVGISVRDLNSRNGTFVDSKPVRVASIEPGDRVQFGKVEFLLTMVTEKNAEIHAESDSDIETAKCPISEAADDLMDANLSKAQRRVFHLLLQGFSEKLVAARLKISQTTVHNHIQAIYRTFGVHSRPELFAGILAKGHTAIALRP